MSLLAKTDKDFDETGGGKKRNYARGSTPFEFNENMTRHNNTFVNGALLSSGNPVGYCQFAGPTDVDRQINFEKNCLISYGSCSYERGLSLTVVAWWLLAGAAGSLSAAREAHPQS